MPGVREREAGFALTELLVAMSVGLIVLMAAFLLLDRAHSASNEISDRQDAVQRGRQAMEYLTRQVRSQVCLGNTTEPITYGSPDQVTFYADLSDGSQNVERRNIIYDPSARTITEEVFPGVGVYPSLTFSSTPAESRVLLSRVERVPATPFLRYFAYDPNGAPGALRELPTPLSAERRSPGGDGQAGSRGHARSAGHPARSRRDHLPQRRLRPTREPDRPHPRTAMSLSAPLGAKLRCQQGFTTVTLMGVLAVGGLLVAAGFAAVDSDTAQTREDQDYKQSYGAAEGGLQWYLNRMGQDNNFYVRCTAVPAPNATELAPVNQRWNGTGADPRIWRRLPGEQAEYTVELMPAPGYGACVQNNQYSMVDPNGNMTVRVTGRSRGEYRTVLATLRRSNFIDFIYFTDFETLDPSAYSTASDTSRATEGMLELPRFEDRVLRGDPVHGDRRGQRAVPHQRQPADLRRRDLRPQHA